MSSPTKTNFGFGFKNLVNSSILNSLPKGRYQNSEGDQEGCDVLKTNNTLSTILLPGWEGIPTNLALNIFFAFILIIGFAILRWKAIHRDEQNYGKSEQNIDWIQFIYSNHKSNENIIFTTKHVNREHPKAYLPPILHKFSHLIHDKIPEDGNEQNIELYRHSYIAPSITTVTKDNRMSYNKPKIEDISKLNESMDEFGANMPTLRTQSISNVDEEEELSHLKSILWNEESESGSERRRFVSSSAFPEIAESPETTTELIKKYLFIKDKDIYKKRGSDALQYLLFQRFLIYFLVCLTIICLAIILPTNLYGNAMKDRQDREYRKTTLINIRKDSLLVWIHTLMTVMIVAMALYVMFSFKKIISKRELNIDKNILLIENIRKSKRKTNILKDFLIKKFPKVVIKRITFVYDINEMTDNLLSLWTSIEAKNYCIGYQRKYGQRCEVRPYLFGNWLGICGCCRCAPKVDAISYYTKEKSFLETTIDSELNVIEFKPQRMAFIVFKNKSMAKEVYDYFQRKHRNCHKISVILQWICGHEKDSLSSWKWKVKYAPFPEDINWPDIAINRKKTLFWKILMNSLIVIIFLFLSTPHSVLEKLNHLPGLNITNTAIIEDNKVEDNSNLFSKLFQSYYPTITLMLMTAILPAIIKALTTQIPFRTKSDYNHAIMYKSFLFLVLMVLILPSLSIATIYEIFNKPQKEIQWNCIFPSDNGAFFVNYVIASALVGNALEISRLSELATYVLCILFISRNSAEYLRSRQITRFEFHFGLYYPRILLLFAIIVTYSISNPLIAPIGLFYIICKHLLDRYQICHVYFTSKINQRMHTKAILFVYFSLLFLVVQVFIHIKGMATFYPTTILALVVITVTILIIYEIAVDICQYD